ncbi:MAG: hypothetical protein WCJ31_21110, partial [Planctomycetia bacterium]
MRRTGELHMRQSGGGRSTRPQRSRSAAFARRRRPLNTGRSRSAVGLVHEALEPRQLMTGNDPADFGGRF